VETHCEHTDNLRADFSIVTEKIYKAMLYKKPFILLSQSRTLQVLRECGYKTFDHVINESYDKLETFPERLNAISEELNRIRNLDDISLQNLLDSCQENVEHNYNLMLKESFKSIPQEFTIRNFIKYD
jgi:septation ring formation regulator EzrA